MTNHVTARHDEAGYAVKIDFLRDLGGVPGLFAPALAHSIGASLSYEGKSHQEVTAHLTIERDDVTTDASGRAVRRVRLLCESSGLALNLSYTYFPKHKAVLIGCELENTSETIIQRVTDLRSFDLAFDCRVVGDPTLHTIGGGVTHWYFPPVAFQTDQRKFLGSMPHPFAIDSGRTGRSSDKHMPFFHVESGDRKSGIFGGLEWSGVWHIGFTRQNDFLYIRGGITDVDLTLRPAEKLALPRALIGFYDGDIHAGRNALRRFIRDWFPKLQGEDIGAPVTWNHAYTFLNRINDEVFRKQVPVNAELGFEWMQIDWGWYSGANEKITRGIGNWNQVEPTRFPNGIEPLADLVRSHGMKYCTWIDPEQAHPSTWIAREHPEWMLYVKGRTMGLVNFGLREVQDFFIGFITELVRKWGVYKLKWDNNIDPLPYWSAHDDPLDRGRLQINHIRGVYRVWEELRRINPGLVLENCSSGGRRFDLGTFGRAHIHHGSDFNFQNDIVRNQISGCNTVMPTYRVIHTCCWGTPDANDSFFMSRFGGILRFSQDFASWPPEALARVKKHIAVYKSIRHLLKEDFYALFPQPLTQEQWDGWQFHDPQTGEGFVMCFRMQGEEATQSPRLHGLQPAARYRFTDPYSGEERLETGEALMNQGLEVTLPEPDSALLYHYQQE